MMDEQEQRLECRINKYREWLKERGYDADIVELLIKYDSTGERDIDYEDARDSQE